MVKKITSHALLSLIVVFAVASCSCNNYSSKATVETINKKESVIPKIRTTNKNLKKVVDGNESNTSIRYRLVDRNALYVPNPVYTCAASGTVVVNISVDAKGRVIAQSINENSSSTTNGCLWDAALDYASQTVFSKAQRNSQLGSITYYFPGQG